MKEHSFDQRLLNTHQPDQLKSTWSQLMLQLRLPTCIDITSETNYGYLKQLAFGAHQLGQQCRDPASAFLVGYQMAVRCIDPSLKANCWSAFCINERGVTSLRQMSTLFNRMDFKLSGHKSFALMANQGLDSAIIIARSVALNADGDIEAAHKIEEPTLAAVTVSLPHSNIKIISADRPARFLPSLPHAALEFNHCSVTSVICSRDAHARLNKPFRFWEDVMVTLSFAGWIDAGQSHSEKSKQLRLSANQLIDYFPQHVLGYDHHSLMLVERLHQLFHKFEADLPSDLLKIWQRDRQILSMSQPIRDRIKQQLNDN